MLKSVGNPNVRFGNQTINSGNLVIGTAGNGIDFSASANAPGMTSELLDDYEEGTWTATYAAATGSFAAMPTTSWSSYTKVGRLVTVQGWIYTNGNVDVTGGSGSLRISGLPFTAAGTNINAAVNIANVTGFAGERPLSGIIYTGGTLITLKYQSTPTSDYASVDVSDLQAGNFVFQNQVFFTASYEAAT